MFLSKRNRTRALVIATVAAALAAVVAYKRWTAGYSEVRQITTRVAAALSAGDHAALAAEPAFHGTNTSDFLLRHAALLNDGYHVFVQRNGANGRTFLSRDLVSHLGVIAFPGGRLDLGFRRDPDSNEVRFVTAGAFTFGLDIHDPAGGNIRVDGHEPSQ